MFVDKIPAILGTAPYNTFDSLLEVPKGDNPNQNAWLTLQLQIKLNFADSTNLVPGLTVVTPGGLCAKDADGWLFPALDWPPHLKITFAQDFHRRAEKAWNFQFALITPRTCSDLDYTYLGGPAGWLVRPNVLCLFRLSLTDASPHRTINVVNLTLRTTSVANADPAKGSKNTSFPFTSYTWRSNEFNYDDQDVLAKPVLVSRKNNVYHDTVGHEIGHALGQEHIMLLKGITTCKTPTEGGNAPACYAKPSAADAAADRYNADYFNIMGGGDRIYLINAVSWRERIVKHCPTTAVAAWQPTGDPMNTPPRKIALGASLISPALSF